MHDEESTSAFSAPTNMEFGLTWLDRTFGPAYRPHILWHIDPSGHALLTPTLAASLGYDALVIDRIPDPVRQAFRRNQSLQFVWTGLDTQVQASPSILTQILDSFYCTSPVSGTTPGEQAASFYADIVRRSVMYRPDQSGHITILWPWGCDFAFQQISDFDLMTGVLAYMGANPGSFPNVTARFGTLGEYFRTLNNQSIAFPTQGKRDFHPYVWCYAGNPDTDCYNLPTTPDPAYWRTGMYTSKVALKGDSRTLDSSTHAADALYATLQVESMVAAASTVLSRPPLLRGATVCDVTHVADTWPVPTTALLPALGTGRAVVSLMTHHDAITGTAYISCSLGPPDTMCNCYQDYMDQMRNATLGTEGLLGQGKGMLLGNSSSSSSSGLRCEKQKSAGKERELDTAQEAQHLVFGNATEQAALFTVPGSVLIIAIGNPLGWARREIVRLALPGGLPTGRWNASVADLRTPETPVVSQVVIDLARGNSATLYWLADVAPLSTVAYAISWVAGDSAETLGTTRPHTAGFASQDPVSLSNGAFTLEYDGNGYISGWTNASSGVTLPLAHAFWSYQEKLAGGNLIGGTVYGFEPLLGVPPTPVVPEGNGTPPIPLLTSASGPLVWEASQLITPWLIHTVRMFAPEGSGLYPAPSAGMGYAAGLPLGSTMEFQTRMGPLPFDVGTGGSIVSAFTPGSACTDPGASSSVSELSTDTSGFQTLSRPPFDPTAYAQSQVYPSWPGWDWTFGPCDGRVSDGPAVLSHIHSGRPSGTGIASNTTVWQMLHRRLNNPTDDRGNETTIIDDVIVVALADSSTEWSQPGGEGVYLLPRQVQARLCAHPLTLHGALFPSLSSYLTVGRAAYTPSWVSSSLPTGVHLHSFLSRDGYYPPAPGSTTGGGGSLPGGPALAVRLQQLPYAPPVSFDLTDWLTLGVRVSTWTETTLDLNKDKASADAGRMVWRKAGAGEQLPPSAAHGSSDSGPEEAGAVIVAFDTEYIRSYVLTLGT